MSYTIPDEPRPSPWNHLVVRPNAPLLASMLCGAWLAWPWFVVNAIAMGSPTKRKEIALCVAAFVGTAALAQLVITLARAGVIPPGPGEQIALLAVTTFKLTITYYISVLQERTFHVYEYYGGSVRAAGGVLTAGYWLRGLVIGMSDDPLWVIIVAGGIGGP